MPLVKPIVTGRGMYLTAVPRPVNPMINSRMPAMIPTSARPPRPNFSDNSGDNDDERASGAADLSTRSAQRRNQEPGHHGCVKTSLRWYAGRNGEGHCQGQRDQADRQSCDQILRKLPERVAAQTLNGARKPLAAKTSSDSLPRLLHLVQHPKASLRWAWK